MCKYRVHLPQLDAGLFLTDGGLETSLMSHQGLELAHFAAFDLLKDEAGLVRVLRYDAAAIAGTRMLRIRKASLTGPVHGFVLGCRNASRAMPRHVD